ncbi:hypothetical protein FBD94_14560 [Pedobacter hiemivivus]|uniref:Uncharacterized protein n=1 Tax=Pedobacter hiemivivus TaxID=2530454 RepID=A0A4U1G8H8_9SPHI|nr:hypothetical protein [Pedobacter hiemivivus]TKC60135.1 hypothetical protein FBD94_14560 [Pedobacter hiemivivus]
MMNLKIQRGLLLYIMATGLIISACTFSRTYVDRADDIQEGKQCVNNFYNSVSNKNYAALDLMTSGALVNTAGKNAVSKIVKLINRKVGNYKSYLIVDSNTVRTSGSSNKIIYRFKIKVTYEDGVVDEQVGLEKLETSDIKVMSYYANSDLLIQ